MQQKREPQGAALDAPAARALLRHEGYEIHTRTERWFECLIERGGEQWLGCGLDEDAALIGGLRKMCPSGFAWGLLEARLAQVPAPPAVVVEPTEEVLVGAPPALPDVARADAMPSHVEIVLPALPVLPAPEEAVPASAPSESPLPEPAPAPMPGARTDVKPKPARATPPARLADALAEVQQTARAIDEQRGRLARLSPERQRFEMLRWICDARAQEEALPGEVDLEHAVGRVARRLTELGKLFWPGSVRPLVLSARPADVLRELGMRTHARAPTTWREGADLTRSVLEQLAASAKSDGLDEEGWADAAFLAPAASAPNRVLEDVGTVLGEVLDAGPAAALAEAEIDALVRAARRLRWIRGAVADDVAWCTAIGRLRRALPEIDRDRAQGLREALDPRHRPRVSWASLLGADQAGAPPKDGTRSDSTRIAAELAAAARTPEALHAWLVDAIEAFNTPRLVELLQPYAEEVSALGLAASDHPDRRIRRRLRDIGAGIAPVEPPEIPVEQLADGDPPPDEPAPHALAALGAQVRARTQGNRVLFVSNREDPGLRARLEEMLGVNVTWCEGKARRVQAEAKKIGKGSYDLVLCATGLLDHQRDLALAAATRAAGVPYIRVNRGRPAACVQAIARQFGIVVPAGLEEASGP